MSFSGRPWSRSGLCLLVIGTCLAATPLPAQERTTPVPSLRWVPADAGTYAVSLRNREQVEAIRQSKAWARLWSLPVVQMGWQMVEAEWQNEGGKLAQLRSWYEQPGNAELVRFFGELFEEEVFSYGSKNSAGFVLLMQEIQAANQLAPLKMMLKQGPLGANDPMGRIKLILQLLAEHPERLKLPDMVIGFKLSRTKPAQIAKWMGSLEKSLAEVAPALKDRMETAKIQGANVHTLVLAGDMVPWDMIPLAMLEDQPGEFDNLVKRLKEMKITIGVTVRGNYLLLSFGEGTAALEAVGEGLPNRLSARTELVPLAKFADRKLLALSYTSKEFATALAGGSDPEKLTALLTGLVKDAGLPAEKQAQILKDVKGLTTDLKQFVPQPGASLSFAFLSKRGSESYTYDWSKDHGLDGSKPLTLLTHLGGQPLGFAVSRERGSPDAYELFVRVLKLGHQYFEEFGLPHFPDHVKQAYDNFMEDARPLFARLDRATGKLFLPSLDGQVAIVLDAKLKSKQWHMMMPPASRDLPLPEIGLILGVQDAAKFRKALQEYRIVYNGLVDAAAKIAPGDFPAIKLPEPTATKQKGGTLYWYPLPMQLGLDQRIGPAGAMTEKLAVFTLSPYHAQRLLTTIPLKEKAGPLANSNRPLASAAFFDWAGFVDFLSPWVEYGLIQAHQGNEVIDQVQSFMEILKVFRSHASATYFENGVAVTHGESVVRDLDK